MQNEDQGGSGSDPALSISEARRACLYHRALTQDTLRRLAPTAGDGHLAHLHLFAMSRGLRRSDQLPTFLTRGKRSAALNWDDVGRLRLDKSLRAEFEARCGAGEFVTSHLVRLAEPMIHRTVQRVLLTRPRAAAVVDVEDLLNTGRLAVAQGVWAYEPASSTGPWFLIQRIEESTKRELLPTDYGVSVPHRVERMFTRLAAVRNHLRDVLGRDPWDDEILSHAVGRLTRADLALERETHGARTRTRSIDAGEVSGSARNLGIPGPHDEVEHGRSGWREVVRVLGFDNATLEIVSRLAALPPYQDLSPEHRSERAVAETTGTTRAAVRATLRRVRRQAADEAEQLRLFLRALSSDDREGLGLQCFAQRLDRESA